jgi:uncharacterized protein (TIGR02217 family)
LSFHENAVFPEDISYGSAGGPGFNTSIVETDSGQEERVSRWSAARHRYDVALGVKNLEAFAELKTFYMARGGAANGFRYKDWWDYHSHPTDPTYKTAQGTADQDCYPATGDGSNRFFQLIKKYTDSGVTHTRTISKPVTGTTRVWVNGVEATSGWTINVTTGIITFTSAPTAGHTVKASFEFDVPVRFDDSADKGLSASIDDFSMGSLKSVNLVEIMNPAASVNGEFNYGGAKEIAIVSNLTVSPAIARFWNISAAASLSVFLPDPTDLPLGGPIMYINNGGSNSFTLKTDTGVTLCTLAAGQGVEILLTVDNTALRVWIAQ